MATKTILIIDDDKHVSDLVKEALENAGFHVESANSLFQAQGVLRKTVPIMIILDRRLPDGDGADFRLELRKGDKTRDIPVLFLTAKKGVSDLVLGLRMGGDDYLVKPFGPEELLARTGAILRRIQGVSPTDSVLEAGPVRVDMNARKAYLKGEEFELWPKAYELLILFLKSPNKVLTREHLLEQVWGSGVEVEVTSNSVDAVISHLRKKLGKFGEKISAVRGYGFRFDSEE